MIAVAFVVTDWANVDEKNSADVNSGAPLGWAILVIMNIMLSSDIRQLVPSPAVSIVSLILLALFLPVSVSPRIWFLGAAWLSRDPRRMVRTVFLALVAVLLAGAWHGLLAATSGASNSGFGS
jgi:hypothetical protein